MRSAGRFVLVVMLGTLLAACASTSLVNQWRDPGFGGPPLRRIMVVGVTVQPSVRRVFEDEFVAQLRAAGVDGVQSYTVIPEDGQAGKEILEQAVEQLHADGVLVTRLVNRTVQTQVTPGFYQPAPVLGFYGWYSAAWIGYYEPPMVYQYDVVTAETSLYSPPRSKLLWSGTTQTFAPTEVKKETAGFAKVIIGALRKEGII